MEAFLFSDSERDRRWSGTRSLMTHHGLDAVIARATPAPDGQGHYRWLSMWAPPSSDGAVVFDAEGQVLVAHDGAHRMFAAQASWFDTPVVAPGVIAGVCDRLAASGAQRVGVADLPMLPSGWIEALRRQLPATELVDIGPEMLRLRTPKSNEELSYIRRSAELADEVWRSIREFIRPGRTEIEALALADHHLRRNGCDQNFNLVMHTDPTVAYSRQPSDREFVPGDSFLFEISPRLNGYFSQLTNVVTIGPATAELTEAFQAGVASRAHAAKLIQPGVDAREISRELDEFVQARGQRLAGPSFGHVLGLELEEPRFGATAYEFVEDSVFVFHPVLVAGKHAVILRGDTYQVRASGLEKFNTLDQSITEI